MGLRLALTGAIKDELVETTELARYLLYTLNRKGAHEYVTKFGLTSATDDIQTVLQAVGTRYKFQLSRKAAQEKGMLAPGEAQGISVDMERAATALIRMYR